MSQTESTLAVEPGLYPIRRVAELTGVNPMTLRAWERRYRLVTPQRTAKGHRLYSNADIELIQRVRQLLAQGVTIGRIPALLAGGAERATEGMNGDWGQLRAALLDALARFDENGLDEVYNRALAMFPVELVQTQLVSPAMQALGEQWQDDPASVAQEHFFSTFLRNKIGARLHHGASKLRGRRILLSCLPGERHELGLLLFALALAVRGFRPLLLGADLPFKHLYPALARTDCAALVLSGTITPTPGLLDGQLPTLSESVDIPVFVGGDVAEVHERALYKCGAIPIGREPAHALSVVFEHL